MKARIRQLIDAKADGNLKRFAEMCGVSQQTMVNATKYNQCSADTLAKIVRKFDDINARWLLTGNGDMTRPYGLAYAEAQFLKNVVRTLELAALVPKMSGEQARRFQIATAQGRVPDFTDEEVAALKAG